jgi:hypothetical protein
MTLITKLTSPGWLYTSAVSTPPGVPRPVNGNFGAATTNPAAAHDLSNDAYSCGTVPRPWEKTTRGYGPPPVSGGAFDFGVADARIAAGYQMDVVSVRLVRARSPLWAGVERVRSTNVSTNRPTPWSEDRLPASTGRAPAGGDMHIAPILQEARKYVTQRSFNDNPPTPHQE